jgi:predicted anti-sigma-YlaC factor YlaD
MQRLTCREFVEFLSAYLACDLPSEETRRFDEHLSRCPPCVHYVKTFRVSGELVRVALRSEEQVDKQTLPNELIKAILDSQRKP